MYDSFSCWLSLYAGLYFEWRAAPVSMAMHAWPLMHVQALAVATYENKHS
jgi:hypothetical protein